MLIELNGKAYIADEVEDGKVTHGTEYVFNLEDGRYTRVGESVEIKGKYKEIFTMNVRARHSVKSLDLVSDSESAQDLAEHHTEEDVDKPVEPVENTAAPEEVEEVTESEEKHTFESLKALTKVQQCAICKEMGMKGYHNIREDERIELILKKQG